MIYVMLTRNLDDKKKREFDATLDGSNEPVRDKWGTGPQAEAGQNAMMAMMGRRP